MTKSLQQMWTYLCSYSKWNNIVLPFRYSDLCKAVLDILGGKEDGFAKCPYCNGRFAVDEVRPGYTIPLSRGGDPDLKNIELLCKSCFKRKKELTSEEYFDLLKFIDSIIPLKRKDILDRNKP